MRLTHFWVAINARGGAVEPQKANTWRSVRFYVMKLGQTPKLHQSSGRRRCLTLHLTSEIVGHTVYDVDVWERDYVLDVGFECTYEEWVARYNN